MLSGERTIAQTRERNYPSRLSCNRQSGVLGQQEVFRQFLVRNFFLSRKVDLNWDAQGGQRLANCRPYFAPIEPAKASAQSGHRQRSDSLIRILRLHPLQPLLDAFHACFLSPMFLGRKQKKLSFRIGRRESLWFVC